VRLWDPQTGAQLRELTGSSRWRRWRGLQARWRMQECGRCGSTPGITPRPSCGPAWYLDGARGGSAPGGGAGRGRTGRGVGLDDGAWADRFADRRGRDRYRYRGGTPPPAAAAAPTSPATGDSGPDVDRAGVDRIIIYIGDLDRCPPHRVVAMLEAVHLLPAIELFVVVVAVDPRWLLRAVAAHYHDVLDAPSRRVGTDALADPHEEELWRSTPAQYLEKIFQVVLTLPPLDTGGYQRLLHSLVGPPDRTTPRDLTDPPPRASPSHDEERPGPGAPADSHPRPALDSAAAGTARPTDLTADPDELRLLDLLGPPHLVATPSHQTAGQQLRAAHRTTPRPPRPRPDPADNHPDRPHHRSITPGDLPPLPGRHGPARRTRRLPRPRPRPVPSSPRHRRDRRPEHLATIPG
jgi:hypothetical protein